MSANARRPRVWRNARGTWCAQVYLGTAPDGRKVRPYRTLPDAGSEEEARRLAEEWVASLTAGGESVRSTLVSDLLDAYVEDRAAKDVAPNTARQWRTFARAYVDPYIGGRIAQEVTAHDLSALESRLLAPRERGGRGLARGTVRDVHTFLSLAFDRWVGMGICESNPMRSVTKPRADRHEAVAVDEWDFATLDAALADRVLSSPGDGGDATRWLSAWAAWLALHTGMRLGETCAVRRRDVSRRLGRVRVCGSVYEPGGGAEPVRADTKGRRSRSVSLTERELDMVGEVVRMQDSRAGRALPPDSPLVTLDGSIARPSTVSRGFSAIRDACGLPRGCTFHSLRHTHATWLLLSGVDVKTVSERLGHADEAITLRVYAHVMPGRDQAAAAAFERFADEARGGVDGCKRGASGREPPPSSDGAIAAGGGARTGPHGSAPRHKTGKNPDDTERGAR